MELLKLEEFENWLTKQEVKRNIDVIQQHHTYIPDYSHFKDDNHLQLQRNMRNYHVNNRKWDDIGQHFTTFPDGKIVTGRTLNKNPACIRGKNQNAICIENLGNFDKDEMTKEQKKTIIKMTALLFIHFDIRVDTTTLLYHHWYDLQTGKRTTGHYGSVKTCPGAKFFGGNKIEDCEKNLIPPIKEYIVNYIKPEDEVV